MLALKPWPTTVLEHATLVMARSWIPMFTEMVALLEVACTPMLSVTIAYIVYEPANVGVKVQLLEVAP